MSKQRSGRKRTGPANRLGQWWTLHKGDHSVTCDIYTHPIGGELRCDVDGELFATHASWNLQELLGVSEKWKASFEEKDWAAKQAGHRPGPSLPHP